MFTLKIHLNWHALNKNNPVTALVLKFHKSHKIIYTLIAMSTCNSPFNLACLELNFKTFQ